MEPWYKKNIQRSGREMVSGAVFSIIFTLSLFVWNFSLGKIFTWQSFTPLSAPPLAYEIYSAIVFITFGAFLYWMRFYQFLYRVFVKELGDWRTYKQLKAIIWLILIGLAYFVITKIIDAINTILSLLLNFMNLVLYLSPPLGIALIAGIITYAWHPDTKMLDGVA